MRESASTDLREPQGSNPLGPPGPELQSDSPLPTCAAPGICPQCHRMTGANSRTITPSALIISVCI